jgi:hypothetical protein
MEENLKPVRYYKKRFLLFFTLFSAVGMLAGAAGGYLYYLKVGCISGTCMITSSPWISTLWGGAIGYLMGDILNGKKGKKESA